MSYRIPAQFTWRETVLLIPCVGIMFSAIGAEMFGAIQAVGCTVALLFAAVIVLRSLKSFTVHGTGITIHRLLWAMETVPWSDVVGISLVGDETCHGHPFQRRGLNVVFKSGHAFLPTQGLPAEQALLAFVRASIPPTCEVDNELPAFLERHV